MHNQKPKTVNGLMKYLRDNKGMSIGSSLDKRRLRNIGYYHGYKGYRYISRPSNIVAYSSFDELYAVYSFDSSVKALLYPRVMQIETALKNYVLEKVTVASGSSSFTDIYNTLLNYSLSITDEREKKIELKRKLNLRDKINRAQTNAFNDDNEIAKHFLSCGTPMPIWAIFELISLGEFGNFVACLNTNIKLSLSSDLGLRPNDNQNGALLHKLIFVIKDLRNAIAHNEVVFDTRFKSNSIANATKRAVANATGIYSVDFESIVDYYALIVYMLSLIRIPKTELKRYVKDFEEIIESLKKQVTGSIFDMIVHTDYTRKLAGLKRYIQALH